MSLSNYMKIAESATDYDEIVSESAIDSLCTVMVEEALDDTEQEEFIATEAMDILTERSIVKLDQKAKKNRAIQMAILQCAKEDNNKDYQRLITCWKMEKLLMARLIKKYKTKAMSRAKKAASKLSTSGLPKSQKAGNNATKKLTQFERRMKNNNKILKSKPIASLTSTVNKIKI